MIIKRSLFLFLILLCPALKAQVNVEGIDYSTPRDYKIKKIIFTGARHTDMNICLLLTGLYEGETIQVPGEKISKAISNLWKQGLFDDIKVYATEITETEISLEFNLKEHPRLQEAPLFSSNIKKGDVDNLREKLNLAKGDVVNDNVLLRSKTIVQNYFVDKGFLNCDVKLIEKIDSTGNRYGSKLMIDVNKHSRVKIRKINITGNDFLSSVKIKHKLKKTKESSVFEPLEGLPKFLYTSLRDYYKYDSTDFLRAAAKHFEDKVVLRLLKGAKFSEEEYTKDKASLIEKYNELGFRDAKIISDTIIKKDDRFIDINLNLQEGKRYYFRKVDWIGNTKYTASELNSILKISKGDIYNLKVLEANLNYNPAGVDVSSLYMDDGYLFFQATPVEVAITGDSIDIEVRIIEGKQAYINKVSVRGNTKTNDHVIIREIRSKPGQLFSRADIIRTTRELAQLKYFDAEKIQPDIQPNPIDGTVDIEYAVQETSSDQLELSGGWGMGRIIGTLGVSFNNFSTRNFFKKAAWQPLPSGDGQKLSVRAQSNGAYYQAYNASFTEPWLGGKKPNAFSISVYYSVQSNGLKASDASRQSINIWGASVGLGKRLTWPDDYFTLYHEINYRNYKLQNYYSTFNFSNGTSNNLNYTLTLSRNSIDAPIYPRSGSEVMVSVSATPPYSLFSSKDYNTLSDSKKYEWIEYHKWKFNTSWFTKLAGNLVLNARTKFGFLGLYNRSLGIAPFERFYLGGDGLSGFALDGRELIGLRGYSNNSVTPRNNEGYVGGTIYNKYTLELRYPISLNPMATVYLLGFAEAGNSWERFKDFGPFDVKRSAGVGVRIFLPMFGVLGLDWGYGFDKIPGMDGANKSQFHFSINQSID
ncbi:MAG: POTRA domain-containing protein [Bacteroidota bacterium]